MSRPWSLEDRDGRRIVDCGLLRVDGVEHLFSTREDGENRAELARSSGLDPAGLRSMSQVHGDRVLRLRDGQGDGLSPTPPRADGAFALRADGSRRTPSVRTADCVPVLLVAKDGGAVAAVHAGWRGTAAGILRTAVESLSASGVAPGSLLAAVGPAIGSCCYEVSPEVVEQVCGVSAVTAGQVTRGGSAGRPMLDLKQAVAFQLVAAGLGGDSVSIAPWCTACREDLFFSYRRDGRETGRMTSMVGWKPTECPPP